MEAEAAGCGGEGGSPAAGRSPQGEGRRHPPASVSNGGAAEGGEELVELKVIWNKNKYDVKFRLDGTGADLKQEIHSLTGRWGRPRAPRRGRAPGNPRPAPPRPQASRPPCRR